jgi:preprotein translocase subunit SecA
VRPEGETVDVGGTVLAHVMLVVLDEKWKDHLYDLDQLRNSINYRAWGQKDPLVEYKGEAYTMFVDLMHDIYTTFTERFLRAQLVYGGPSGPPQRPPAPGGGPGAPGGGSSANGSGSPSGPRRRYNALGLLEDVEPEGPAPQPQAAADQAPPAREPGDEGGRAAGGTAGGKAVATGTPMLAGAGGRPKPLGAPSAPSGTDWPAAGRNDPCPCGSGKKFKKCHGAGSA